MRGQMLLIVVLVMVVILTVGLSAASRTITSIRVSTDEEDSERAFSAAEAGLEVALSQTANNTLTGTLNNSSSYRTTVRDLSGVEFLLNNSLAILKDDTVDVWLSRYPNYTQQYSGNLTIYWGSSADLCDRSEIINTMSALDIVVISGSTVNPTIRHYPVDPCPQRRSENNFGPVASGGTVDGRNFAYSTSIAVSNGILARIIPLYASSLVGVRGCNAGGGGCLALPAQGTVIESVGTSDNAQRKIISYRAYPKLPSELFPFVIFVPN